MRRIIGLVLLAGTTACLNQPTLVSITPEYAYEDGCAQVVLQGKKLGTTATGTIGSAEIQALAPAEEDPDREPHAQDVGFLYTGVVPPAADGAGWYDVTLTVDGEALTLPDGFYYRTCPETFRVDAIALPQQAAPGDTIPMEGCGLSDAIEVRFLDSTGTAAATTQLVSDCSTAQVHVEVPNVPDGMYLMVLVHPDGTTFDGACEYNYYGYYYDTAFDTGDLYLCTPNTLLITGGAR
jgi:hypothetical protein